MIGTVDSSSTHPAVPVLAPRHDARHNAHDIRSAVLEINGIETTVLVQPFSDRIFVLVTQMNKMGTIVS